MIQHFPPILKLSANGPALRSPAGGAVSLPTMSARDPQQARRTFLSLLTTDPPIFLTLSLSLYLQDSRNNFLKYARYVFYLVFLIPFPVAPPASVHPGRILTRSSAEFQKHRSVNKKDFGAIEYLLRKGHRQLEMYASPGIRNIR